MTVSGSGRLSDSTAVTVDSGAVYNVAVSDTVASIAGAGSITLGSNTLTSGGSDARRPLVVSSQERMVTLSRQVQGH